jgi:heme-degrading monooxygenase HmoA
MAAITLINSFEVPTGRENEFFEMWKQVNDYMQKKPGYLGHRLHRAVTPEAPYRFVNVARWASKADFDAAHDAGFRELVTKPEWSAFPSRPFVFEAVHHGGADTLSVADQH